MSIKTQNGKMRKAIQEFLKFENSCGYDARGKEVEWLDQTENLAKSIEVSCKRPRQHKPGRDDQTEGWIKVIRGKP